MLADIVTLRVEELYNRTRANSIGSMSCPLHLHQPARSTRSGDRITTQQVALPLRKCCHPLHCTSLNTRARRPAQRWVCSTEPDGPQKSSRPRNNREKALQQFTEQLKSRQTKPKLSLQETVAKQWKTVLSTIPLSVGIPGTAAVVAAYYLHLDPYGHFHWSSADALIGLACIAPLAALDAAMMIPDFSSGDKDINKQRSALLEQLAEATSSAQPLQSDQTQSRLQDALQQHTDQHDAAAPDSSKPDASQSPAVTEASQHTAHERSHNSTSTAAGTVSGSESAGSGQQQAQEAAGKQSRKPEKLGQMTALWGGHGVVTETLDRWQRKAVLSNPGLDMEVPVEIGVICLSHFADEMLLRAVILQGLALWVTDRLYEANAEDIISGIGDSAMAVSDAGKWTALAVLIGVRLGSGARGLLTPLQVSVEAVEDDKPNLEPPTVKSARRKRRAMENMVNRIQKKMTKQMKAALVVNTTRGSLSTAVFGGSFILTGNLLAPYVGAVTCDLLFSYYQRSKYEHLKTRVEQRLKKMLEGLMEMKAAKSQIQEAVTDASSGEQPRDD